MSNPLVPPPADPYAPPTADVDGAPAAKPASAGVAVVATRGARFVGAFVDGIVYSAVRWMHGEFTIRFGTPEVFRPTIVFGMFVIACVQWYLIATRGQSIGKMAVRTQIVRRDGSPAGFVAGVALRSWIIGGLVWAPRALGLLGVPGAITGALSVATSLLWLVDVLFIFGSERLCLHDYIAGTKVIVVRPAVLPPVPASGP